MFAFCLVALLGGACSAEDEYGQLPTTPEDLSSVRHTASSLRKPCLIARESLQEYAARCEDAMGGEIPGFECEEGSPIPNEDPIPPGNLCNAPNVLNRECDPGSKFQVLKRGENDGIYIVAHCRKIGWAEGDNHFADVAMIAHNKNTGATCFFQALGADLSGSVVAPRKSQSTKPSEDTYYKWQDPATTASQRCIGCHDNGPFLRSPYLGQLAGKDPSVGVWLGGPETPLVPDVHYLPGTKQSEQFSWNSTTHPYSFVGTDFQSWKTYRVDIGGECTSCHRMAISTNNGVFDSDVIGTARDYGKKSTAPSQLSKSPHGVDSPIWMRPGDIDYQAAAAGSPDAPFDPDEAAARRVATCAEWIAHGRPSASAPPGICRDILFGQGNTCSDAPPQVVGGATQSTNTGKKAKTTVHLGGACVAGQYCEAGFPYLTTLHGPFFQRSAASIPIDSPNFRGAYVRTFANTTTGTWDFETSMDASDLPTEAPSPGQPGGTIETINYSRVASILSSKKCTQNNFSLSVAGNTPLSAETNIGYRSHLAVLGTLIGNVSPNSAEGASRLFISQVGSDNLLQQYHAAQPTNGRSIPSWFTAGGYVHSCPSWRVWQHLVADNVSTSSDTQLAPPSLASKVICYLTGVAGNWGYTVPDPSNPGGSIQTSAEIYVGPSNDIRLRVFSPDRVRVPVSASASCLRVDP